MCCNRPPYNGTNHIELLRNIESKEVQFPPFATSNKAASSAKAVAALHPDAVSLLKGTQSSCTEKKMGGGETGWRVDGNRRTVVHARLWV
jgi:hypothetical protein